MYQVFNADDVALCWNKYKLISNVNFITCTHTNVAVKIAFYALMHKKQAQLNMMIREIFKKKSARIHSI